MASSSSSTYSKLFWLSCAVVAVSIARSFSWHMHEKAHLARWQSDHGPSDETNGGKRSKDSRGSDPKADSHKKQGTEDDLSIATLEELSRHPNYDIRQAARKVALYRFAQSSECTTRLRRALRDEDNRREATDVLRSLVMEVDPGTLLGDDMTADADDFDAFLEDFLGAESGDSQQQQQQQQQPQPQRPTRISQHISRSTPRHLDMQGHMLTLEEIQGENGEVVSVRVPSLQLDLSGSASDQQASVAAAEQELRRWQRREAMVVQFDTGEADESAVPLYMDGADDAESSSEEEEEEEGDEDAAAA